MDDIVNRSPDEVKEREFETTGYKGGTDLPENNTEQSSQVSENQSGSPIGVPSQQDIQQAVSDKSTGISAITDAMEEGSESNPKESGNETLGIP